MVPSLQSVNLDLTTNRIKDDGATFTDLVGLRVYDIAKLCDLQRPLLETAVEELKALKKRTNSKTNAGKVRRVKINAMIKLVQFRIECLVEGKIRREAHLGDRRSKKQKAEAERKAKVKRRKDAREANEAQRVARTAAHEESQSAEPQRRRAVRIVHVGRRTVAIAS